MTEAEWLACNDPEPMLAFLQGKARNRKLRLFAAACCRLVAHLLIDQRSWEAITLAENLADQPENRRMARTADRLGLRGWRWAEHLGEKWEQASRAVRILAVLDQYNHPEHVLQYAEEAIHAENPAASLRHRAVHLLRDLVASPLPPMTIDPTWATPTVRSLAQAIYAERAFDRLPILADALEEAGCTEVAILEHCRGPGPHVRGCWVVDLILGKE